MEQYPSELIRGIANQNELDNEGNASTRLFVFRPNPKRTDNKEELSISWCDDKAEALSILMHKEKEGVHQFKAGAALISRKLLDLAKKAPVFMGKLAYERAPLTLEKDGDDNKFHGNITCVAEKQTRDLIRAALCVCVTSIISRERT